MLRIVWWERNSTNKRYYSLQHACGFVPAIAFKGCLQPRWDAFVTPFKSAEAIPVELLKDVGVLASYLCSLVNFLFATLA